ncbi:MAG TPA: xanthine dehydrogenase family protein subunit M [Acetobacteraceae bacterium]|jgi:carbon-monoxide dehydrogenase medium subunit|nr:xanthine dehydrogenase family protein subunit M [Acetobacteraceae bacterium]
MSGFAYAAPSSVSEAASLLAGAKGVAKLLSGGTDLLVQLRSGRLKCDLVVDTKKVPGIFGISEEGGAFVIGAATPGAEIGAHEGLREAWPGIVEAATLIGSTQVQGRATLAGNLCNASPAADSVPALIAARAVAVVAGPAGTRDVPVEQIITGPGRTSLARDEFVLQFRLPPRPRRAADAYLRLIPRTEMDIAVVGCGVNLQLGEDGTITDARVCLGAVAPTPVLVQKAASVLIGGKLDDKTLDQLATAAEEICAPIEDKRGTIAYRTRIAGVLARRAATIAHARAEKAR